MAGPAIPATGVVLLGAVAVGTSLTAGIRLGLPGASTQGGLLAALGIGTTGAALRYHGGCVILGRPAGGLPPRQAPDPGLD